MRLRKLCPVCGSKMIVVKHEAGDYLTCSVCPLEYGYGWDFSEYDVIRMWEVSSETKKTRGRTKPKPVVKIDKDGNVLARYSSLSEAAKNNPMARTSIKNRIMGNVRNEFEFCDFSFRLA